MFIFLVSTFCLNNLQNEKFISPKLVPQMSITNDNLDIVLKAEKHPVKITRVSDGKYSIFVGSNQLCMKKDKLVYCGTTSDNNSFHIKAKKIQNTDTSSEDSEENSIEKDTYKIFKHRRKLFRKKAYCLTKELKFEKCKEDDDQYFVISDYIMNNKEDLTNGKNDFYGWNIDKNESNSSEGDRSGGSSFQTSNDERGKTGYDERGRTGHDSRSSWYLSNRDKKLSSISAKNDCAKKCQSLKNYTNQIQNSYTGNFQTSQPTYYQSTVQTPNLYPQLSNYQIQQQYANLQPRCLQSVVRC